MQKAPDIAKALLSGVESQKMEILLLHPLNSLELCSTEAPTDSSVEGSGRCDGIGGGPWNCKHVGALIHTHTQKGKRITAAGEVATVPSREHWAVEKAALLSFCDHGGG